jgi:hypothetical protein
VRRAACAVDGEDKQASGKLLERCSADPRQSGGIGGAMATRKSNVINFPQPINPERKDDDRIAEQFFEKIDGLVMEGLRRDLAAAEASTHYQWSASRPDMGRQRFAH